MRPTDLHPGQLGHPDQIASAVASIVTDGPAAGCRAVDLRVYGGVDVRLLPDRGLDLGAAWFAGTPLAWISPVGEHGPSAGDYNTSWGGGLLTTCGLRNVGAPSEGHGLHGAFHQQRAREVRVERGPAGMGPLTVHATVREASASGAVLEVSRTVTTHVGTGRVQLRDVTRNLGPAPEPAPLLYHCNLGAPLWVPGAEIALAGTRVLARDAPSERGLKTWRFAPEVLPGAGERVFEHVLEPDDDGWAQVRVDSPPTGLTLTIRWDATTLPRLHQWVHPGPGMAVLGLEPANCSVGGRAADRAAGRLPWLAPGEERETRLELLVASR